MKDIIVLKAYDRHENLQATEIITDESKIIETVYKLLNKYYLITITKCQD